MSSTPSGTSTSASSVLPQSGPSELVPDTNSPAPVLAPPSPNIQGVTPDPTGQSLLQQQQQVQQTYLQMQAVGYPPLQPQQYYTQPPVTSPPVQAPYPGQYPPSPQGPPAMGYNQYPPAQFQQTYPQMQQGNPMQTYPPFQQQQEWGQQPTGWQQNLQNYGYNQGGYGGYQPQGTQVLYNGASGGYPPPTGQYPQAFAPIRGPITAGYFPTSSLPYIPPTIGYYPPGVEEASPQVYPPPDCSGDVELIVKAFSNKLNTDEGALIQVLSKRSHPLEIASRKKAYASNAKFSSKSKSKDSGLLDIINNRTFNFSGGFKSITHALVAGPLELDVFLLRKAIKGAGTIEQYLDMVLLCRSNEDIKAISQRYCEVSSSSKTLLQALEGDLSGDILALYRAVLLAERYWDDPTVPLPKEELERNIKSLYAALTGKADVDMVITFFVHGSFHRLASISREWKNVTNQKSLESYIEEKFYGHMKDSLSYILLSAKDRTLAQATMLDKSLRSSPSPLGHKEEGIAVQVVKLVWEDQLRVGTPKTLGGCYTRGDFLKEVDSKYRAIHLMKDPNAYVKKGAILPKIKNETSGDFEKFLVYLWENQKA